jgi:hypothetical protein
MKIAKFNENRNTALEDIIYYLADKFDIESMSFGPFVAYYLKDSDIIEMSFEFQSIEEEELNTLLEMLKFIRHYDDVNFYISSNYVDEYFTSVAFYINNISEDAYFTMGKDLGIELDGKRYNI